MSMNQNDESTAVSESHGLSEVETKLMEAVAAGVPPDKTPAYFEYSASATYLACASLLTLLKLGV